MKPEYFSDPNIIKTQTITLAKGAMKTTKSKSVKKTNPRKSAGKKSTKKKVKLKPAIAEFAKKVSVTSQPYIITITNNGKVAREVVILGKNKYLDLPNHGNHKDIVLENSTNKDENYQHVINDMCDKNIEVNKIYLRSTCSAQITQTLFITSQGANGDSIRRRVNPIFDPYQQLTTILPVNSVFAVDGSLYIKVKILASSSLELFLYPISKNSGKSSFESLVNAMGYFKDKQAHTGFTNV